MRLFIGLALTPEAAADTERIAARTAALVSGRYVSKDNYHITLAFLGDVPETHLDEVCTLVADFAASFSAPLLTLGSLSYFKRPENAILIRTVFSPAPLNAMHDTLIAKLIDAKLPFSDGPFSPHVTLARHADLCGTHPQDLWAPDFCFTASCATLYLSARDENNILRYTPLHSAHFGKP